MQRLGSLRIRHIAFILFSVGFLVHITSLGNAFVWDDEQFIVENAYVQDLSLWPEYFTTNTIAGSGFSSGYYRPLTTFSFALDVAVWGMHPLPFHVVNTALHAGSGVLLFLVLLELFSAFGMRRDGKFFATLVSLAFLLHPAQVEAITYMNSRGDSLFAFFGLLSLYAYIRMQTAKTDNAIIGLATLSSAALVCSMLSKEIGIMWAAAIPLVFFVHAFYVGKRERRSGMAAMFLGFLGIVYSVLRFTILRFQDQSMLGWDPVYLNSITTRVFTFIFRALPEYIGILILPVRLHMERHFPFVTTLKDVPLASYGILAATGVAVILALLYVHRTHRGACYLQVLSLGWFFVFLIPVSGIVPVNGLLYEHWLYIPMVGWWTFWALPVAFILRRVLRVSPHLATVTLLVIGVFWCIQTLRAIQVFRSPFTLYANVLKYTDTARVRNNLGMAYADIGDVENAQKQYRKALEISDVYPQTHHNLGNLYQMEKQYDRARESYEAALSLDPDFIFSIVKLIELESSLQRVDEAVQWAEYGKERFPKSAIFPTFISELNQTATGSTTSQPSLR